MEQNPNMDKIVICKVCKKQKEHHAKGMCNKCYKKHGWERKKIICKNCEKERYHKAFGLCGTCHIKLHHYDKIKAHNYRKWHNISLELYRKMTQKCLICDFDKIVELHHLDGDHKNSSEKNLVGLCPNHHKLLHDGRYSIEAKKELEKILNSSKD